MVVRLVGVAVGLTVCGSGVARAQDVAPTPEPAVAEPAPAPQPTTFDPPPAAPAPVGRQPLAQWRPLPPPDPSAQPYGLAPLGGWAQRADAPDDLDYLLPTTLSTAGAGALLLILGGSLYGSASNGETCGLTGCADRPDPAQENVGAVMMGAGAGLFASGGLGALGVLANHPGRAESRRSQPLANAGFGVIALSQALFGMGIAQGETYDSRTNYENGWPLLMVSTLSLGVGIPMLVIGSKVETSQQRSERLRREALLADPRVPTEANSSALVVGGGILTGLGAAAMTGGTAYSLVEIAVSGGPGLGTALIGLPGIGAGTLFTAIGVPMIVVGGRRNILVDPEALPALSVSGSGASLAWRLP